MIYQLTNLITIQVHSKFLSAQPDTIFSSKTALLERADVVVTILELDQLETPSCSFNLHGSPLRPVS